jgi:hypothetical protein
MEIKFFQRSSALIAAAIGTSLNIQLKEKYLKNLKIKI